VKVDDLLAIRVDIGWPAAVLGGMAIAALMWTISNKQRTSRLASLIRAACGRSAAARRK
jgi:hypothetical protein